MKTRREELRIVELNKVLRGELAAVGSYDRIIESLGGQDPARSDLVKIRDEHRGAVSGLSAQVTKLGGVPEETPGFWGRVVTATAGSAKLLGKSAKLVGLEEGEKIGLRIYEKASGSTYLDPESRKMIETSLLPMQKQHVSALRQLRTANQ